ncbi:hypothetical protein N9Y41_01000 [Planktomarina temperata]|nr:hypothetical protein [Planktomarina temperata]
MSKNKRKKVLNRMDVFLAEGDISAALHLFRELEKKFPHDKFLLQLKEKINTAKPNSEPEDHKLAPLFSAVRLKKYTEVLETIPLGLKKFPNSINLFKIQAVCQSELGNYSEAARAFLRVTELQPGVPDNLYNLGKVQFEAGYFQEASETLNECLNLDSKHSKALGVLGTLSRFSENYTDAVMFFERTLSENPFDLVALRGLSAVYTSIGVFLPAVRVGMQVITLTKGFDFFDFDVNPFLSKDIIIQLESELSGSNVYTLQDREVSSVLSTSAVGLFALGELTRAKECLFKAILCDCSLPEHYALLRLLAGALDTEDRLKFLSILEGSIVSEIGRLEFFANADKYLKNHQQSKFQPKAPLLSEKNSDALGDVGTASNQQTMVTLRNFGRSGTGMFHSLFDGHAQIATFPSVVLNDFFNPRVYEKFIGCENKQLIKKFIQMYPLLFDSQSSRTCFSLGKISDNFAVSEGLTTLGDLRDEHISVSESIFQEHFLSLAPDTKIECPSLLFELLSNSYDFAVYGKRDISCHFYHIHNPNSLSERLFPKLVPKSKNILLLRNPVQSLESWIRSDVRKFDYTNIINKILGMLGVYNNRFYTANDSFAVKLEDLKNNPNNILAGVTRRLNVSCTDTLFNMTANGKKWWGDPGSPTYQTDGMNPFGLEAINKPLGEVLTNRDAAKLELFFNPFFTYYNYEHSYDVAKFSIDNILVEPFDFECRIADYKKCSIDELRYTGLYKYFRSGLLGYINSTRDVPLQEALPTLLAP